MTISGYDLGPLLGRGSYASVFELTDKRDGRVLVGKQIRLLGLKDDEVAITQREIAVLESLDHPNIVRFVTSFTERDCVWIVMEKAEDGTLLGWLRKHGPPPFALAARWGAQLCSALAYLHKQKILHRDLKTENIFLSAGNVKLGDFGLARRLNADSFFAATLVGTPYYLSPEICRGEKYAFASDVWSLGCVLFELVAGLPPFRAENLLSLVALITEAEPSPDLSTLQVPGEWAAVVRGMLNKNAMGRMTLARVMERIMPLALAAEQASSSEGEVLATGPWKLHASSQRSSSGRGGSLTLSQDVSEEVVEEEWGGEEEGNGVTGSSLSRGGGGGDDGCYSEDEDHAERVMVMWGGDGRMIRLRAPVVSAIGVGGSLAEGTFFACVSEDKSLITWGQSNKLGQLGQGSFRAVQEPRLCFTGVSAVACGTAHAIALTVDGRLFASGDGSRGQTGLGMPEPVAEFTALDVGDVTFDIVSAGASHSAAVSLDDGGLFVWGAEQDEGGEDLFFPGRATSLSGIHVVAVACSGGAVPATAVVTYDADVMVVLPGGAGRRLVPSLADLGIVEIAAGASHFIARSSCGKVFVWTLGDEESGSTLAQVPIPGPASRIAAGDELCIVAGSAGRVWLFEEHTRHHEPGLVQGLGPEPIIEAVAVGPETAIILCLL